MTSAGSRPRGSGPKVALLYQRLLALVFLVAWASLGSQIHVLIGSRGLLPIADVAHALESRTDVSFADFPSLLRWHPNDAALTRGVWAGVVLALLALFGALPRLLFGLSSFLYLSFTVAARDFLSFQWDNLLLECGALAVLLPANRRAPLSHFLLRAALFKLYFESGIAKYESYLGDWKDGSAMAYYYETAPIPTWVAWYAHHLPAVWHKIESWATLAFELACPILIFTPRAGRLVAFSVFTVFQIVNIATANYGFFSYLALVLGVVLLDDSDVEWAARRLRRLRARSMRRLPDRGRAERRLRARWRIARSRLREAAARLGSPFTAATRSVVERIFTTDRRRRVARRARTVAAAVPVTLYVAVSAEEATENFWPGGPRSEAMASLAASIAPFRIVNTYHLFGSITRERVEPTFETFDGSQWTEHDLHYKPGPVTRAPPFVAPHQPRVDFLLWFYGLSYERGVPAYVQNLLTRLCTDPDAVAPLFAGPLADHPSAARVSFYQYHFTSTEQRNTTGSFWARELLGGARGLRCGRLQSAR